MTASPWLAASWWAVQVIQRLSKDHTESLPELENLQQTELIGDPTCQSAVEEFEVQRIQELESKRDLRKS